MRSPHEGFTPGIPMVETSNSFCDGGGKGDGAQPPITEVVTSGGTGPTQPTHMPRFTTSDRSAPVNPHVEVREQTFPSTQSEQKGHLLVSTNIGPKSFTIQRLPDTGAMISKSVLGEDYVTLFGDTSIAKPRALRAQPSEFCKNALVPHGLVAQEYVMSSAATEQVVGYGLTDSGQQYGLPASAVAIEYENTSGQSLLPVLGAINANQPEMNRAPVNRACVLQALAAHTDPVRFTDLIDETGMNTRTLRGALVVFDSLQLAKYDASSGKIGRESIIYAPGPTDLATIEPHGQDRAFSEEVAAVITSLTAAGDPISNESIYRALPRSFHDRFDPNNLRTRVRGHVGQFLRGNGLLYTHYTADHMSDATITDKGKDVVTKYLGVIDNILADDPKAHADAQAAMQRIKRDPVTYARRSAEVYYPYSRTAILEQRDRRIADVAQSVVNNPDGITIANIYTNTQINQGSIQDYLTLLERRGEVTLEISRGAVVARPILKKE